MFRNMLRNALFAYILTAPCQAFAQDLPGDAINGQRLAEKWCASCHEIHSKEGVVLLAPDFKAMANSPSINALSLNVFFQTPHRNMPDIHLTRSERDDLIAYILDLRQK